MINYHLLRLFDYANRDANLARQRLITDVIMPPLQALSAGSGAYLNEADPNQADWQQVFYGDNYDDLAAIKRKYDPHKMFYVYKGVGSEDWTVTANGQLCKSGLTVS